MNLKTHLLAVLAGFAVTWAAPDFSLVGFGAATTGGSGKADTVTSYNSLKSLAETGGKIIYVNGTIENGEKGGIINVKSNTSIIGVGTKAFFNGVGINIKGVSNIVVRNLKMTMIGVTFRGTTDESVYDPDGDEGRPQIKVNDGDCIHVEGASSNIWIDHNEFYAIDPATQTNQDLYDGLVDVKNTSHSITISWNYFHDHHKTHLIGSSDSDISDRKITFHHNHYSNVKERLPLYRGGTAHVFSNYYYKGSGAVNTRVNACVYVEENVFDKITSTIYSRSSAIIGYAKSVNNLFVNGSGAPETKVTDPYATKCSAFLKPSYSYKVTPAAQVEATVKAYAGVGKIDGTTPTSSSSAIPVSSSSVKPSSSSATPVSSSSVKPSSSSATPMSSSSVIPVSSSSTVAAQLVKHGAGSSTQTVSVGASIAEFNYTWTGATTVTVTGLPSGIIATIDNAKLTVSFAGAPMVAGTFKYTIATVGGSTVVTKSGTFTVVANSTPSSSSVIQSSSSVTPSSSSSVGTSSSSEGTTSTISKKTSFYMDLAHGMIITPSAGLLQITFFDVAGHRVKSQKLYVSKGVNYLTAITKPQGAYVVRAYLNGNKISEMQMAQ